MTKVVLLLGEATRVDVWSDRVVCGRQRGDLHLAGDFGVVHGAEGHLRSKSVAARPTIGWVRSCCCRIDSYCWSSGVSSHAQLRGVKE